MSEVTIRRGKHEDSAMIAQLFLLSSDGLAEYIWSKIAEPGETASPASLCSPGIAGGGSAPS